MFSPYPITASAFVYGASIFVATAFQTHLLSRDLNSKGCAGVTKDLLDQVQALNEPLPDYHPQLLMQCLLAGKLPKLASFCWTETATAGKNTIVDRILLRLAKACKQAQGEGGTAMYTPLDAMDFVGSAQV